MARGLVIRTTTATGLLLTILLLLSCTHTYIMYTQQVTNYGLGNLQAVWAHAHTNTREIGIGPCACGLGRSRCGQNDRNPYYTYMYIYYYYCHYISLLYRRDRYYTYTILYRPSSRHLGSGSVNFVLNKYACRSLRTVLKIYTPTCCSQTINL